MRISIPTSRRSQSASATMSADRVLWPISARSFPSWRGDCTLAVDRRPELLQQHGLFHGGVTAFLVDNATTIAARLARPVGADGRIQTEFAVAGIRRAADLPRARDQARTSGRGGRGRCLLRDRRNREAHRDRTGVDRDARREGGRQNPKPGLRAGLVISPYRVERTRVTSRKQRAPGSSSRRASGSKNSPAAASASAAASWSS